MVAMAILVVAGLSLLLWQVLAPGGWTFAKLLMLAGFAGAAPWLGLCGANGLCGVLIRSPKQRVQPPRGALPQAALAVAVRNEDPVGVVASLHKLILELDRAGVGEAFTPWVLSDTTDPALARAEEAAIEAFPLPGRLRYRRRTENHGYKAGNVMEFLDCHAGDAEVLVLLDADSEMTADAVLRLVHALQAEPHLAIVQHLTVGLPTTAGFARLFQFGMRAGMRSWARATAWWQGDEACYWGHNAAIRIAPFRAHGRLAPLPDGSTILSHDQIEAAQLAGAGWGVRLLADEDGSFEDNPPVLPEFLRRELRWMAGNFQYWPLLLRQPGLRAMGRWQLAQAILLFSSAPFYALFLAGAFLAAATDRVSGFPAGAALALTLAWLGTLYSPKWLSYAELLASPGGRARYGGVRKLLAGMAAETVFTLLMDPVTTMAKAIAVLRLALGRRAGWAPQNRHARGVPWLEACRLLWPQTAIGLIAFGGFASAGLQAVIWAAPLAGGLLLAIPFCVFTAHPAVGRLLARHGIAAMPEEVSPAAGSALQLAPTI